MAIKPELAGGFRDYLPGDMIPRQQMLDTIRFVFERFGFLPLETPAVEKTDVLTGGDAGFTKQIFYLRGAEDEKDLALRFDLTVPLARVVAAYPDAIEKPFKRYQMGKVWRGERPQAGRFREFMQFDADTVGAPTIAADAEIVTLMYTTLTALGFEKFKIRVNNRKILNGLAEYAGFEKTSTPNVLRAIDKLDRDGWQSVARELGAGEGNVGLSQKSIDLIQKFIEISSTAKSDTLNLIAALMEQSPEAQEGIRELVQLRQYVIAAGVPDTHWEIDLSVARGLGYYTGPVFETLLTDYPQIGSVFSGGRYDDLVARFGGGRIPAVGASIGVDRLFAAMEKLNLVPKEGIVRQVLLLNFDSAAAEQVISLAADLRTAQIPTDVYFGQENTLKGQLAYAVKRQIPVVGILGSNELEKGTITIKNMQERSQEEVKWKDAAAHIAKILKK